MPAAASRDRRASAARFPLLLVTILGTMSNNIVNVPLRSIATDLDAPVSSAVLLVSSFVVTLAVAMPMMGWLGDRIGMKRTLMSALVLMFVAQALAAIAPNLPVLAGLRSMQGLACAAIPPMVMGLLLAYHPEQRIQMMAAWATANGVGQAAGPPIGGLVSDLWGWRMVFVLMAGVCLVVMLFLWWLAPVVPHDPSALDLRGLFLITSGIGALLIALTAASQQCVLGLDAALATSGVGMLLLYARHAVRSPDALIPLPVLLETRYLRSVAAAFAQMFCLGTFLVAVPLVLTGPIGLTSGLAGAIFFVLPAAMTVGAPISSRLSRRFGPRRVLRTGLTVIVLGAAVAGLVCSLASAGRDVLVPLIVMLVIVGVGMAFVQTPAAAGATGSPAGRYGAAVGLFSTMRFSGSGSAAAWVALTYSTDSMMLVFGGCATVGLLGLVASFVGRDPKTDVTVVSPPR